MLKQNWQGEGFSSKAHEKRMFRAGQRMLKDFFQKSYDPKMIPHSLEQLFVVKPSPTLKVGGRIDRVDKTSKSLEIIDYKTGKTWDQKQVDESLQMTVYALAAADKGIFDQKPERVILSFYFLDSSKKLSTKRTAAQLKKARQELVTKAEKIAASDFSPQPSRLCDWCEYRLLCEAWI